jgi:hypothetical protein
VRRDDDLLRQILIDVENSDRSRLIVSKVISQTKEEQKFAYHVELLCDAGFMTSVSNTHYRMTNQGHDYLEAIRSETVWKKTKQGAAEVGGMTLGMMKDLAVAYLKQEAAEKLGISL